MNMGEVTVEFQGVVVGRLVIALAMILAALPAAVGVWQLTCRRRRQGLWSIGAAVGPVLVWLVLRAAVGERLSQAVWIWLLGGQVIAVVGVFYAMVYHFLGAGRLAVLLALRSAAVIMLMLALFKPIIVSILAGPSEGKASLAILLDRSASMFTADASGATSRYERAIRALSAQHETISENFQPLWGTFSGKTGKIENIEKFQDLMHVTASSADEGTDIAGAISTTIDGVANAATAGILLISDGNHNASEKFPASLAKGSPVAIHTIGVGDVDVDSAKRRNIELVGVDAPMRVMRNNVTTISARIKMAAMASTPAVVQLFRLGDDKPLASAPLWTDRDHYTTTVKLKWTPTDEVSDKKSGKISKTPLAVHRLRVVIPPLDGEAVKYDNSADLHVLITEPKIRLLYVEGTMRPEYKYLKRMLDSDPNVQFASLVRVAENRFWAYGSINGQKPSRLPETDEDFARIDVLVLGDLDSVFLGAARMSAVRKFVNGGGALLMLGGESSLGPGGYGGTDIETILPVVTGPRGGGRNAKPFVPSLTAIGKAHPIMEGIAEYFSAEAALAGCTEVLRAKPAAVVLAINPQRSNSAGPLIVLAVQQYGPGRTAVMTADTTWRWYLRMRGKGKGGLYSKFWGQLIRWLARADVKTAKSPPAVVGRLNSGHVRIGEAVKIRAAVQAEANRKKDAARIECAIAKVGLADKAVDIPLASRSQGFFHGEFTPTEPGRYRITFTATDASGRKLAADELDLSVTPHLAEMDKLARNVELLRDIAAQSSGSYADITGLPETIDRIVTRAAELAAPKSPPATHRLYNFWLLFAAFLALITTEWTLRRKWQLR